MALIPLTQPTWHYDTATKKLVLTFRTAPEPDDPDAASYRSDKEYQIEVPVPNNPKVVILEDATESP